MENLKKYIEECYQRAFRAVEDGDGVEFATAMTDCDKALKDNLSQPGEKHLLQFCLEKNLELENSINKKMNQVKENAMQNRALKKANEKYNQF